MFKLSRLAGRLLAAAALAAALLVPGMAFADEAVSFNGEALGTDANKANAQTVYFAGSDWRVIGYGGSGIAGAEGTATLLAANVIGNTYFNEWDGPNSPINHYEGSLLQDAVDGIADGIPEGEEAAIVPRTLASGNFSDYSPSWTVDCVAGDAVENALLWPLSTAEANSLDGSLASLGTEWWWLRSPGDGGEYVAVVDAVGSVYYLGYLAYFGQYGVRPAFNLNLTSVLFSSAAEGGKSGGVAAGNLSALSGTSSVSAWKLTLRDSLRVISASATGTTAAEGYSAWSVPVTFSGGGTAANDYVSAILCDADGNALYYGTVANATASGTQGMAMPTGLATGTYTLKVFSEQRNGDFKTDYAGPFVNIELTVEAAPAEHTVRFVDEDGTEISTATYAEGTAAADIVKPADPTKAADEQYTYTFAGWTPEVVAVAGDATYTATYEATPIPPAPVKPTLTITAKDQKYTYNGQIQGEGDIAYEDPVQIAEKVTVEGLLEGDELTSVVLDGQGQEVGDYLIEVTGFSINNNPNARDKYDVVLVPGKLTINPADPPKYTVTFVDDDGTVISSASYPEGTAAAGIEVPADPTKTSTAQYAYTFAGWSPEIADVTGDAIYTATYTSAVRKYTVTWKDDDGSVIDASQVEYGKKPTHTDPTKAATAQYTYKFAGWSPEVVAVTGDATYTATYEATPVPKPAEKATLTFDLAGGTLDGKTGSITVEANVGDTIKLPAAPKREGYTFKYWKGSQYAAGADYKVEGDHSFTAVWEKNATSDSSDSDKKSPLPATGDDNATALTLCTLMALASLALLSGSVVLRRRGSAYKGKYSAR